MNHPRLKQWDEKKTKTLKRTQHTFLKEMDISPLSSFLPYQWWFDPRPVMLESWCAHWVCNQWKSQTGRLWLSPYIEPLLSSPLLSFLSILLYSICRSYLEVKVMNLSTYLCDNYPIPFQNFESFLRRGKIDVDVDHFTLKVIQTSRRTHGISTLPHLLSCFSVK